MIHKSTTDGPARSGHAYFFFNVTNGRWRQPALGVILDTPQFSFTKSLQLQRLIGISYFAVLAKLPVVGEQCTSACKKNHKTTKYSQDRPKKIDRPKQYLLMLSARLLKSKWGLCSRPFHTANSNSTVVDTSKAGAWIKQSTKPNCTTARITLPWPCSLWKKRFWCTVVGWIVQSSPVQLLLNPVQSKGYPIFPTKYSWSIQT